MEFDGDSPRRRVEQAQVLDQDRRPRPVGVRRRLDTDATAEVKALEGQGNSGWVRLVRWAFVVVTILMQSPR